MRKVFGTYTELNVRGKVFDTLVSVQRAPDVGGSNDTLLTSETAEERVGELRTGIRHGEGCTSRTGLGLDDLITTKLHTVNEVLVRLAGDALAVGRLREEGDDRVAGVTTDDGDGGVRGVVTGNACEETGGTNNIEGTHTEDALGVVDTGLLVDSAGNGDQGVDRVGNNAQVGLGRNTGDSGSKVTEDRCVCLDSDDVMKEQRNIVWWNSR